MTRRCGAWQVGDDAESGALEFRVFFPAGADPHVQSITVAGDFQAAMGGTAWDFARGLRLELESADPVGAFWSVRSEAAVPAGFYEYRYLVEFDDGSRRYVTDPCTRYGGLHDDDSGVVVGGTRPADNVVRPLPGGRRPLSDLVVYELMIDDFTAEYRGGRAPLAAVEDKLDDLVALGVTAILFLPWTAWKNRAFDWGYEPFQYFAVEARYANDLDRPQEKLSWLKKLISACHDRDIHVIMDGVFNHVSVDFPYKQLYLDPTVCPFTAEHFGGAFPGLQDLDFANACTGELVRDVCRYWIEEFGIDGIRFDNTVNYYVAGDPRGLPELLGDIDAEMKGAGEHNFSLTLEHIDRSAATVTNATAATSFWDNSLFEATFSALWNGTVDGALLGSLNNRRFLASGKVPTLYLSNHDHSHVAWQAGARQNVGATGAWWRIQPFLIALFTATAVPLVHNGQEFGEEHFLPENDYNTGRRVTGRPLRWKLRDDPIGRTLVNLHARLAALRAEHPALRSATIYPDSWDSSQMAPTPEGAGMDVEHQTAVYHRWGQTDAGTNESFVIVLNFADVERAVMAPFPARGTWQDVLAGFDGGDGWSLDVTGDRAAVSVGSHWGRILWHQDDAP